MAKFDSSNFEPYQCDRRNFNAVRSSQHVSGTMTPVEKQLTLQAYLAPHECRNSPCQWGNDFVYIGASWHLFKCENTMALDENR